VGREQVGEPLLQVGPGRGVGPIGGQVADLVGIGLEVVELGAVAIG
jgi:hypothetical protein